MSALSGHKFIVIGDSYTVGITGGGATIDSWLDYFVRWYGNEWAGYYANPEGGYGFAKTNNQFITLLNGLDNVISDKTAITDILVAGGYNDHAYVSSLSTAIAEFASTAREKYPNATLWIAPIGWTTNQYQSDVSQAIEAYITYGKEYGYRVLEEMKNVMRNTAYLSSDEIHPNEEGYQALARKMYSCLISYLSGVKIAYNGADKWKIRATELLNQGGGGGGGNVDDVTVNGTSVVTNKVAEIDLTSYAETSDLATVATSGDYDDLENKPTIPAAQIQSDWTQSNTSSLDYIKNKPSLATVATSGSYNDLSNKPTIPAAQVNSDWNASSGVAKILNKPSLATVATSGSYNDLSNKPTIPTTLPANGGNADTVDGKHASDFVPSLAAIRLVCFNVGR